MPHWKASWKKGDSPLKESVCVLRRGEHQASPLVEVGELGRIARKGMAEWKARAFWRDVRASFEKFGVGEEDRERLSQWIARTIPEPPPEPVRVVPAPRVPSNYPPLHGIPVPLRMTPEQRLARLSQLRLSDEKSS